jgi:hypothetical protein
VDAGILIFISLILTLPLTVTFLYILTFVLIYCDLCFMYIVKLDLNLTFQFPVEFLNSILVLFIMFSGSCTMCAETFPRCGTINNKINVQTHYSLCGYTFRKKRTCGYNNSSNTGSLSSTHGSVPNELMGAGKILIILPFNMCGSVPNVMFGSIRNFLFGPDNNWCTQKVCLSPVLIPGSVPNATGNTAVFKLPYITN